MLKRNSRTACKLTQKDFVMNCTGVLDSKNINEWNSLQFLNSSLAVVDSSSEVANGLSEVANGKGRKSLAVCYFYWKQKGTLFE